ncbi:MAG: geranylgeranyl reductase family protein [Actinomycetota bacterium]
MSAPADVVIVGAGPAGCAAAIGAVRRGLRTVVLDRATFPRDKTCGDGLTTAALRILEGLGLARADLDALGAAPVPATVITAPSGRRVVLPMPTTGTHALVVERRHLDARLVDAARAAGAEVREGHTVERVEVHADGVTVDGIAARHLVAADGHWSPVRRMLEPGTSRDLGEWHAVRQYFAGTTADRLWVWFAADLLPGYLWVFPLGAGRANVGYGVLRADRAAAKRGRDLKDLWPTLLARPEVRAVLGPDARAAEPVRAWPIPTRYDPARLVHGPRVRFVGDAAGVVDPMTGEGIAQAMETGLLAAESIATGADYARLVHRALGRDLRFAALLQRVLARRWGADLAISTAGLTPWTRRNFARWMWEDYPRAILGTPDRWHRGMLTPPGAWADAAR